MASVAAAVSAFLCAIIPDTVSNATAGTRCADLKHLKTCRTISLQDVVQCEFTLDPEIALAAKPVSEVMTL